MSNSFVLPNVRLLIITMNRALARFVREQGAHDVLPPTHMTIEKALYRCIHVTAPPNEHAQIYGIEQLDAWQWASKTFTLTSCAVVRELIDPGYGRRTLPEACAEPHNNEELLGCQKTWYSRLVAHVDEWQPEVIETTNAKVKRNALEPVAPPRRVAPMIVLTGPPGTGKTCVVRNVLARRQHMLLYATTPLDIDTDIRGTRTRDALRVALARMRAHLRTPVVHEPRCLVVFIDDLETALERNEAPELAVLDEMAEIAMRAPRRFALVAASSGWMQRDSPLVLALRTRCDTACRSLRCEVVKVPPVPVIQIIDRLGGRLARGVALLVNGDIRQAVLSMLVGSSGSGGGADTVVAAPLAVQLRDTVAAPRKLRNRGGADGLVASTERQYYDGGRDPQFASALLFANAPLFVRAYADEAAPLVALANALDALSEADIYETSQRASGYGGRDGYQTDARLYTALGVTVPARALTPSYGTWASRPKYDCSDERRRQADASALDTVRLVRTVAPIDILVGRSWTAAQELATTTTTSTTAASAVRGEPPESFAATLQWGKRVRPRPVATEYLERLGVLGLCGPVWCRRIGLDRALTLDVVGFSHAFDEEPPTAAALAAAYSAAHAAEVPAVRPDVVKLAPTRVVNKALPLAHAAGTTTAAAAAARRKRKPATAAVSTAVDATLPSPKKFKQTTLDAVAGGSIAPRAPRM